MKKSVLHIEPTPERAAPTVLIAYHAHCIDGFTAAWIAARALAEQGKTHALIAMNYDEESIDRLSVALASTPSYTELFILDYSLPVETLKEYSIYADRLSIVLLDHHKTAFERYAPDSILPITAESKWRGEVHGALILLYNNHSGAGIAWNYFHGVGTKAPTLVSFVEDYDLWRFAYGEDTKKVNKVLAHADKVFAIWDILADRMADSLGMTEILQDGAYMLAQHKKQVQEIVSNAIPVVLDSWQGLTVECSRDYTSSVGHELAKLSTTFGLMYSIDPIVNKIVWSLRSDGDFDVSDIAKKHGGGGHKNAAGFETKLFPETPETEDEGSEADGQ